MNESPSLDHCSYRQSNERKALTRSLLILGIKSKFSSSVQKDFEGSKKNLDAAREKTKLKYILQKNFTSGRFLKKKCKKMGLWKGKFNNDRKKRKKKGESFWVWWICLRIKTLLRNALLSSMQTYSTKNIALRNCFNKKTAFNVTFFVFVFVKTYTKDLLDVEKWTLLSWRTWKRRQ